MHRVLVITVSDTRSSAEDRSGDRIEALLRAGGYDVSRRGPVKDDLAALSRLVGEAITEDADVIVLTGGTGIAPRDVTPEAIAAHVTKRLDGYGEEFRRQSIAQIGPRGMLSRASCGVANGRIVVALPGSVKAVELGVAILLPMLEHAITLARGETPDHAVAAR